VAPGTRHSGQPAPTPRPRIVERRIYVAAPPAVVWAALHDPRSATAIQPELRLGQATGAWPAAGSTRTGQVRLGMLREPVTVESREARPASRFRYRVTGASIATEWTWTFEAHAGGTRVIHAAIGGVGDRWAGWLAGLAGDPLPRAVEAHLRGLKAVAEAAIR
jgi:carbon monoxide dehydrogenase subunit G